QPLVAEPRRQAAATRHREEPQLPRAVPPVLQIAQYPLGVGAAQPLLLGHVGAEPTRLGHGVNPSRQPGAGSPENDREQARKGSRPVRPLALQTGSSPHLILLYL